MDVPTLLFDRLDAWRHLPAYQLERRADVYFSLYLHEVLEAKFGIPFNPRIVPEFPFHLGTIYPDKPSNQSVKLDYLAFSDAGDKAFFVELKTDMHSRRTKQDDYIEAAVQAGLPALIQGVKAIFFATNAKRKYFHLLHELEELHLLDIPDALTKAIKNESLVGVWQHLEDLRNIATELPVQIVYVQPNGSDEQTISFYEFADVVAKHEDAFSKRFAKSLREWGSVKAGNWSG